MAVVPPKGIASLTLVIVVGVLLVLGGGTYIALNPDILTLPILTDNGEKTEPGDHPETDHEADEGMLADEKVSISWELKSLGEDEYGRPNTHVTLVFSRISYSIGTFIGSCGEIGSGKTMDGALLLEEGEVSAVQCFWGGGGNEIGVFKEDMGFVVKIGGIGEPSAYDPGYRDGFKTRIDLSAGMPTTFITENGFSFRWPYEGAYLTDGHPYFGEPSVIQLRREPRGPVVGTISCGTYGNYEGPYETEQLASVERDFEHDGESYRITYRAYEYNRFVQQGDRYEYTREGMNDVPDDIRLDIKAHRYDDDETVVWHEEHCSAHFSRNSSDNAASIDTDVVEAALQIYETWK